MLATVGVCTIAAFLEQDKSSTSNEMLYSPFDEHNHILTEDDMRREAGVVQVETLCSREVANQLDYAG